MTRTCLRDFKCNGKAEVAFRLLVFRETRVSRRGWVKDQFFGGLGICFCGEHKQVTPPYYKVSPDGYDWRDAENTEHTGNVERVVGREGEKTLQNREGSLVCHMWAIWKPPQRERKVDLNPCSLKVPGVAEEMPDEALKRWLVRCLMRLSLGPWGSKTCQRSLLKLDPKAIGLPALRRSPWLCDLTAVLATINWSLGSPPFQGKNLCTLLS